MASVRLEQYTEKSIAVFGNTQPVKDKLQELGGKFNSNLRGQPGWIFPLSARPRVEEYVNSIPAELPIISRPSRDNIIDSLIARIEALEATVNGVSKLETEDDEEEIRPKSLLRPTKMKSDVDKSGPKRLIRKE